MLLKYSLLKETLTLSMTLVVISGGWSMLKTKRPWMIFLKTLKNFIRKLENF